MTRADLDGWAEHTDGELRVHVLPGDHFFLATAQAELLALVGQELAPYLDGNASGQAR